MRRPEITSIEPYRGGFQITTSTQTITFAIDHEDGESGCFKPDQETSDYVGAELRSIDQLLSGTGTIAFVRLITDDKGILSFCAFDDQDRAGRTPKGAYLRIGEPQ